MAYEESPLRSTGELITAAHWNQDIRNNIRWLAQDHWRAQMSRTTTQTITTATVTQVDWTVTDYDFGSLANLTNNTFVVPVGFPAGVTTALFHLEVTLAWDINSAGQRVGEILKNGLTGSNTLVADRRAAEGPSEIHLNKDEEAVAGDFFKVQVFQDSGANRTINPVEGQINFSIRWLAWQD